MASTRYISLFVFLAVLTLPAVYSEDCNGENEEYYSCASPCRRSCDTLAMMLDCTGMCVSGCFCKPGYYRRKDNACVKSWLCEKSTVEYRIAAGKPLEVLQ